MVVFERNLVPNLTVRTWSRDQRLSSHQRGRSLRKSLAKGQKAEVRSKSGFRFFILLQELAA
jgi:hypothetical protein